MYEVVVGNWGVQVSAGAIPDSYDWLVRHALLSDEIDLKAREGKPLVVAVRCFDRSAHENWKPVVVSAQVYWPAAAGFNPGVLIVPETAILFIGAGRRLLAYNLNGPSKLWDDSTECGFLSWGRSGDYLWMEGELEFAVWSTTGVKLWTTFVEPPWSCAVSEDSVVLDVMGKVEKRRLSDGVVIET